jgi:hypothetical protein
MHRHGFEEMPKGFRERANERVKDEEFSREGSDPLLRLQSARSITATYPEGEREHGEAAHDK